MVNIIRTYTFKYKIKFHKLWLSILPTINNRKIFEIEENYFCAIYIHLSLGHFCILLIALHD